MNKKYPAYVCTLFQTHIPNKLITVKTNYGYAILNKIDKKWRLGTLSYLSKKDKVKKKINIFKHIPEYQNNFFIIDNKKIEISNLSFERGETELYFWMNIKWGVIYKKYTKQIPVK